MFDALDIVATFCYEELSRPAIVSSIFSFFSIWYGLVQRRHDFDDLSKMGATKPPLIHLTKTANNIGKKMRSVGKKMSKVTGEIRVALRERARTRGRSTAAQSDEFQLAGIRSQSPVGQLSYEPSEEFATL